MPKPLPALGSLCTWGLGLALLIGGHAVHAQQVYKIVGPDGRVSFSDKPPSSTDGKVAPVTPGRNAGNNAATLPYELREVASRYPVTLYTGANCAPCNAGRALLTQRGVPFSEKTVSTNLDIEALQQLAGETSLPVLTVGKQQLKGFSDSQWSQYLDAAGYPSSSKLPTGFRNPEVSALTVAAKAPATEPTDADATTSGTVVRTRPPRPATPQPPAVDRVNNPAGIKF